MGRTLLGALLMGSFRKEDEQVQVGGGTGAVPFAGAPFRPPLHKGWGASGGGAACGCGAGCRWVMTARPQDRRTVVLRR